jgi:hypothetical protein
MQRRGGVIKKQFVRQGPPRPLQSADAPQSSEAAVRLVSQTATHAVLEVCCPCGQRIQIECEYADEPAVNESEQA